MEDNRVIELLADMVKKQDNIIDELKGIKKQTEMNTMAVGELRLSVMKLIDIIENQIFERISRLENAVFVK